MTEETNTKSTPIPFLLEPAVIQAISRIFLLSAAPHSLVVEVSGILDRQIAEFQQQEAEKAKAEEAARVAAEEAARVAAEALLAEKSKLKPVS